MCYLMHLITVGFMTLINSNSSFPFGQSVGGKGFPGRLRSVLAQLGGFNKRHAEAYQGFSDSVPSPPDKAKVRQSTSVYFVMAGQ